MASIAGRVAYLAGRVRGPEHRFRAIYDHNLWGAAESRSGRGSCRGTAEVAGALAALGEAHRITRFQSIADLPCGDANWIFDFLDGRPDISYVGYDIVEELVEANRGRRPDRHFAALDIIDEVPDRAELVFCRDLFNHLTSREVLAALDNMSASGATWLLASNNFGWTNRELPLLSVRTSRHLDLTAAPYDLPEPLWKDADHALWEMATLRPFIERRHAL